MRAWVRACVGACVCGCVRACVTVGLFFKTNVYFSGVKFGIETRCSISITDPFIDKTKTSVTISCV